MTRPGLPRRSGYLAALLARWKTRGESAPADQSTSFDIPDDEADLKRVFGAAG